MTRLGQGMGVFLGKLMAKSFFGVANTYLHVATSYDFYDLALFQNDFATLQNHQCVPSWQGHFKGWQQRFFVWQRH
jgi:hypothetical protein